jgi:penicillin-binding protein 1A
VPESVLPRPDGIASAPAGDGSRDDYHYAEFKPPELIPLEVDDDKALFGGLFEAPTPSNPGQYVPPAPVPQPGRRPAIPPPPAPLPPPANAPPGELPPVPYDEHELLPET